MGVGIYDDCKNITLSGCTIRNCWGDGVYIGRYGDGTPTDIVIENCTMHYNRRQGISVVHCNGLIIRNCRLLKTQGTAPEAGIDFECNSTEESCKNVLVENCYFEENGGCSVLVYGGSAYEITVKGCVIRDEVGCSVETWALSPLSGYVHVQDCNFRTNKHSINLAHSNRTIRVSVVNCDIWSNDFPIRYEKTAATDYGGVYIHNCRVHNYTQKPMRVILGSALSFTDVHIDMDVLCKKDTSLYIYTGSLVGTVTGEVRGGSMTYSANHGWNNYSVMPHYNSNGGTEHLLEESVPYKFPVTVTQVGSKKPLIKLAAGTFPQLGGASSFTMPSKYDSATLTHEAAGVWSVKYHGNGELSYTVPAAE